ncbi:MAG: redoxin domain-containing protein [Chloroflexi bacterium]|nr:redoxin domain-containing protein [Chloroflexota bacterium]
MGKKRTRGRRSSALSGKGALLAGVAVLGLALFLGLNFVGLISTQTPSAWPTAAADPSVSVPAEGPAVGATAPAFQVTDAFGREVTRSSLIAQQPGLMFFTTTYCLPCIEGLRHLARFQQDVDGDPFNVLIVFVDPYETDADLQNYQQRWDFPQSWFYVLDTDEMVLKYRIRFLDSKFVLDPSGVIRYADVRPANYETWRMALGTVGIAP